MTTFSFKEGVDFTTLHPMIVYAWAHHLRLLEPYGYPLVVTSLADGEHMAQSKHYEVPCAAYDSRIWAFKDRMEAREFCQVLAETLGDDFDCLLKKTHLHVEYDPK